MGEKTGSNSGASGNERKNPVATLGWNRRYRLRSHLRSSLWAIPLFAMVFEMTTAVLVHALDARLGWSGLGFGLNGAQAMYGAVITLSLSFMVFTFGSLLVVIQVASGQYTPRIIATTLLRDNVIRYTAGLFIFTLLFAVKALDRTETSVPQLVAFLTALFGLVSIAAFLYLIDHAARMLRPVSLVRQVSEQGRAVIDSVYPERFEETAESTAGPSDPGPVERVIVHCGRSAIILAVDIQALVAEAQRVDGVIELAPQVGDFVGTDEPLFLCHGGAGTPDPNALRACIAFGSERTMEQDPLFAIRILADIAIKALSKAINDPTTAVLAIDQLQRLLHRSGKRNLRSDQIPDHAGRLRVILRTPDWEDFVQLACCEIRFYGAENLQIARRLRAMLTSLRESLPEERHPALDTQLKLLDRMVGQLYLMPEDLALARIADSQGLGGSTNAGTAGQTRSEPSGGV